MSAPGNRTDQSANVSLFNWQKYAFYCLILAIWLIIPIAILRNHPFGEALATSGMLTAVLFLYPIFGSKLRWFIATPISLALAICVLFGLLYLNDLFGIQPAQRDVSGWDLAALMYAVLGSLTICSWLGFGLGADGLNQTMSLSNRRLTMLKPVSIYIRVFPNKFVVTGFTESIESVTAHSPEPFTTKRLLVGSFSVAEPVLRRAVKDAVNRKWFRIGQPVWALIQPMEMVDGGLSEVEERVFSELAEAAGVDKVVVMGGESFLKLAHWTD